MQHARLTQITKHLNEITYGREKKAARKSGLHRFAHIPIPEPTQASTADKTKKMKTDCQFKITLQLKEAIIRDDKYLTHINIPCGKCGRCIQRKKMEWSFRMVNEMIHSKIAYFVTLTFAPEHVPYNKYGRKTLIETRKQDLEIWKTQLGRKRITKKMKQQCLDRSLQGFCKRVRQNQRRTDITIESLTNGLTPYDKIKFFGCGEYGENNTKRPHYHLILYNASIQAIEKSWTLGGIHIAPATEADIAYVTKYMDKSINEEKNKQIMRTPEFHTMSEGIGKHYIDKNKSWHKRNLDILYVTNQAGIKIPMPKYYREKLFTDEERKDQVIIVTTTLEEIRQDKINELGHDLFNKKEAALKKETERRFRKKIKKRIID